MAARIVMRMVVTKLSLFELISFLFLLFIKRAGCEPAVNLVVD